MVKNFFFMIVCILVLLLGCSWNDQSEKGDYFSLEDPSTNISQDDIDAFESAVVEYQMNSSSLEVRSNPELRTMWEMSPWLEKTRISDVTDGFDGFNVPIAVDIKKSQIITVDETQMKGVVCFETLSQYTLISGETTNDQTIRNY